MSSLDYLDLCRLCLVKDRVSVPIFDGEGDVRQIFLKIAACLPVKVAREDKLPKKICDDCVYKVELFYQFWNTTVNAEKQLLQWLGEVGMEGKQGYVTNVLNPNVMKQEQSTENRLDGSVMQQVSEHQNNMGIGMMDNIGLGIPMIISNTNQQQQITSVPMDTSSNSAQNVQAVPGPSSQTTHNQISQNQTSSTQQEEEEESSEDEENSDDECDGDEGLPVKEESEEDPNSRTIEPTTFVNVSLACDEAGPSGLQQQKIADMPEIPMPQTADGDPKSGMPTNAETPSTQNPPQPLFIECNGAPFLDQDDMPIEIKAPPLSDDNDDNSMESDFERNYDGVGNQRILKEQSDSSSNDILYLGRKNYCPLPNNVKGGVLPNRIATSTPLVPVAAPVVTNNAGIFVPVEVQKETGLNIIKNVLIPIQGEDGTVSYELKNIGVRINAEPTKPKPPVKPVPFMIINPMLPKPPVQGEDGKLQETEARRTQKKIESIGVDEEDLVKMSKEESEKDKVDLLLESLRSVCPSCNRRFSNDRLMGRHFGKMHRNHYRCKRCQYIYESKDILEEHYKFHEKKSSLLECPTCHKKYKHMWGLKRHQIREHSTIEPKAICNEDEDSLMSNDESQNQKMIRLRAKTYACQYCENAYSENSHLVAHKRLTHGIQVKGPKNFKCKVCKRYFRSESNLRSHTRSHERSFYCDVCGGEFISKQSIKLHMRKHTGEKPYKCKVCSRTYAQVSVLRVHKLTHTGERPYVCNICGQRFTQRSSMMIHHRKHPGNHPPPPPVSLTSLESNAD
ncbi:uncharacterized protein LOC122397159 isoform X7 [Colletes gigas]|uniref:uncharacterized protein LOC122397159 isoform X7 n=1 Tax=Colletes gigas TaxID=935657 RepID=UPI001C9AC8A0|nr:uncharacterized protein LOC122397159 isoform X7 [Colletes gigas]